MPQGAHSIKNEPISVSWTPNLNPLLEKILIYFLMSCPPPQFFNLFQLFLVVLILRLFNPTLIKINKKYKSTNIIKIKRLGA